MHSQLERRTTPRRSGLLLLIVLIAVVSCEGSYHSEEAKCKT
jgi:hypothetical protein